MKQIRYKHFRQNIYISYSEVNIMDFNYEEIGAFNAEKAAKGLLELAQKIKKDDKKTS